MSAELGCEQVREIAPDLAIGIADGQERDAALRHAATCRDCRQLLSELSSVVDELLLLAPEREPPLGFESRTLARLGRFTPRRRRLRGLAIAASFAAALVLGSGVVFMATSAERQLADSYREVLAQGQGSFFVAAPLRGDAGAMGTVFGYEGQPSWLFATVDMPVTGPQRFRVLLVTRDGRRLPLDTPVLGGSHDTWGTGIPVALTDVKQLRFEGVDGPATFVAYIDAKDPWSGER